MNTRVGVLPPNGNDRIEVLAVEDARSLVRAGLAEWQHRCKDVRLNHGDMHIEDPTQRKALSHIVQLLTQKLNHVRGGSANIRIRTMNAAAIDNKNGAWVKVESYRFCLSDID